MTQPKLQVNIAVAGPFWSARADLIELADPAQHFALRSLFLDLAPRAAAGAPAALVPGTLLALVFVRSLEVRPVPGQSPLYAWSRAANAPRPAVSTPAEIKDAVARGALSLLLVQAEPAAWAATAALPPLTCLGGEIALGGGNPAADRDALPPQAASTPGALFAALGLARHDFATAPLPAARPGPAALPGEISAHAGGISVYGRAALPWQPEERVAGVFQLALLRPEPPAPAPAFRLSPELERMTAAELDALVAAWNRFGRAINPGNPLGLAADAAPRPAPEWVTLELVNPAAPPRLHWSVAPWPLSPAPTPASPARWPLQFERGELSLVLSDRRLYDSRRPPTSLATVVPDQVTIVDAARSGGLLVGVVAGAQQSAIPASAVNGRLIYGAELKNGAFAESLTLSDVETAYSPTQTAQLLRDAQGLRAPEWDAGAGAEPIDPAVLWGFVPLDDGWAQLPVLNLTDQIYLDAQLARAELPAPRPLLQGAVTLGNSRREALAAAPAEQPWNLTLADAIGLSGAWSLRAAAGGDFALAGIELTLLGPDVVANGLLWLSASAPTAADALPELDAWSPDLRAVPLRSVWRERDAGPPRAAELFPPGLALRIESLAIAPANLPGADAPAARLGPWALRYGEAEAQAVVGKRPMSLLAYALEQRLLPPNTFSEHLPLVWRRHRALPMVQALPLTQTLSPPNHPSASRQLAPFELKVAPAPWQPADTPQGQVFQLPDGWRFGVAAEGGAAAWPRLLDEAGPAGEWAALADLPMAALSLPGLILDPHGSPGALAVEDEALPVQYRFDLPYADEVHALAQLPEDTRRPEEVSPLPADPQPVPAPPLSRELMGEHWRRLAEQAGLAAASAAAALAGNPTAHAVAHLVEPLAWPVDAGASLASYPGSLGLANRGGDTPGAGELRLAGGAGLSLETLAALRGVTGTFHGHEHGAPDGPPAAYELTAGSMAAVRDAEGALRDQRGLARKATAVGPNLIKTAVTLRESDGARRYELTSARGPLALAVDAGKKWSFWFRDVPVAAAEGPAAFVRRPGAYDVNEPDALARDENVLRGYEWRLAAAGEAGQGYLHLCGLHFYPLTLERVVVDGDSVTRVELVGRLQLPLPGAAEQTGLANAVRVAFVDTGAGLALAEVAVAPAAPGADSVVEWPLAADAAALEGEVRELIDARLLVTDLAFEAAGIAVKAARLEFYLFDVLWTLPARPFAVSSKPDPVSPALNLAAAPGDIAPVGAALTLDLAAGRHELSIDIRCRLGAGGAGPDAPAAFVADVRFDILGAAAGTVACLRATLFDDIVLPVSGEHTLAMRYDEPALQFAWQVGAAPAGAGICLLPGMELDPSVAPGCAALTFAAHSEPDGTPALALRTGFVEALLRARWGAFLQDAAPGAPLDAAAVYGSSAGDLAFGFTAHFDGGAWRQDLLLNGFLEVKSLISWPLALAYDAGSGLLTLPPAWAAQGAAPLDHLRHTARILVNQLQVPAGLARLAADPAGGNPRVLFRLDEAQPWQFLAVVEHQLLDVLQPGAGELAPTAGAERRWTAVQEVRLAAPAVLIAFLDAQTTGRAALDPRDSTGPVGEVSDGVLRDGVRPLLRAALAALPPDVLVVEASAPHWVRRTPLPPARPTALQFLPGGAQLAILSGPDDFRPAAGLAPPAADPEWLLADAADPQWVVIVTPFLGRLQLAAADSPGAAPLNPLQVDPILALRATPRPADGMGAAGLALALASRGGTAPASLRISAFDTAVGRAFARLDPLALDEHWFRLQNPPREPLPERLQSVTAALPDTPARLSRSAALRRAFDTVRNVYPPGAAPNYEPPPELDGAALVWRQGSLLAPQSVAGDDALVRYTFQRTPGDDRRLDATSGDPELRLRIGEQPAPSPGADFAWTDGGLQLLTERAFLISERNVTRLSTAFKNLPQARAAISVELWITPGGGERQRGGARIFSIGSGSFARNITIQQGILETSDNGKRGNEIKPSEFYVARLRTTATVTPTPGGSDETNTNGYPALQTGPDTLKPELTHVVYTWSAATGEARFYLNGNPQPAASLQLGAGLSLANWAADFALGFGREAGKEGSAHTRVWRGTFHAVALYTRALGPAEVRRNFEAGPEAARRASPLALYAWHATGLQLRTSGIARRGLAGGPAARHPAATLLPARPRSGERSALQPLGFAISPYLGLERQPAPDRLTMRLVVAELVCLDQASGQLRPVASRFFELDGAAGAEIAADRNSRAAALSLSWAVETHRLLAPDSRVALLRFRELSAAEDADATRAVLTTTYSFALVDGIEPPERLTRRVARLRSPVAGLRFREGQYGGAAVPAAGSLELFELAPPQTAGVQPLYLEQRPADPAGWPWGLSAMRLSVCYTADAAGVVGRADGAEGPRTLWWQAPQQVVQYRASGEGPAPAAGLPAQFRAPPIKSLLPVLPAPPLPSLDGAGWQPVLPGRLRYLLSGARPGAMLAVRNQLIRQRGVPGSRGTGEALVSGSVPVQHRAPRPVPLPPNSAAGRDYALQTWASFFEPAENLAATAAPRDEAFFAGAGGAPDRGLRLELLGPAGARILASWDGVFELAATSLATGSPGAPGADGWEVSARLGTPDGTLALDAPPAAGTSPLRFVAPASRVSAVTGLPPGTRLTLQALVRPRSDASGMAQTLSFPLVVADAGALPLPLAPTFVQFEDPEYNRRLASQAAGATGFAVEGEHAFGVSLAADRRAYNPDSVIALRFDRDPPDGDRGASGISRLNFRQALGRPSGSPGVQKLYVPSTQGLSVGAPLIVDARAGGRQERTRVRGLGSDEQGSFILAQLANSYPAGTWVEDQASIRLRQVLPGGVTRDLTIAKDGSELPVVSGKLFLIDLAAVQGLSGARLSPGEALELELRGATFALVVRLDVVAERVIPPPEAGYALLRRHGAGEAGRVECVRFAWGPPASRVELVSADDLRAGVVRRRAVFQWRDTARVPAAGAGPPAYAVQKLAVSGATHFPQEEFRTAQP